MTVGKVEEIDDRLGINLVDDAFESIIPVLTNPVSLVRVLWILVEEQATAQGVDGKQFGEAFDGDTFEAAAAALEAALENFIPPRRRSLMRSLLDLTREGEAKQIAAAMEEAKNPDFMAKLDQATRIRVRKELEIGLASLDGRTNLPAS